MASEQQCAQAFEDLADLIQGVDAGTRRKFAMDRTVSCRVPDVGQTWSGRVCEDGLLGVTLGDEMKAQVRLTIASEDLLSLVGGKIPLGVAFATGKLRIQASPMDLLRLGSFL